MFLLLDNILGKSCNFWNCLRWNNWSISKNSRQLIETYRISSNGLLCDPLDRISCDLDHNEYWKLCFWNVNVHLKLVDPMFQLGLQMFLRIQFCHLFFVHKPETRSSFFLFFSECEMWLIVYTITKPVVWSIIVSIVVCARVTYILSFKMSNNSYRHIADQISMDYNNEIDRNMYSRLAKQSEWWKNILCVWMRDLI